MARMKARIPLQNGETGWVTGDSLQEMVNKAVRAAIKEFHPSAQPRETPSLSQFIADTYKPVYFASLKPTTKANYDGYLKRYILKFFGDKPMGEIKPTDVQKFVNWLENGKEHGLKENINRNGIDRIVGLLSRIMAIAQEDGIIPETPVKNKTLRITAKKGKHHKPTTAEDKETFLKGLPLLENERERNYLTLLYYTGMRPEEVLGMKWDCMHLEEEKPYCEVKRTVTYPENSKPVFAESCKTELSARTIPLPSKAVEILRRTEHKEGFVIHGRDCQAPVPYSTWRRTFHNGLKQLGLANKYCSYDFRTNFATSLAEGGMLINQVANLMGHVDDRMVRNIYAPNRHEGAMKLSGELERIMQ